MRFSTHFGITRGPADDWFDTILHLDTELFVEPGLIHLDHDPRWMLAHQRLVDFLDACWRHVASTHPSRTSPQWREAVAALVSPEAEELCLGYTARGTSGSGVGDTGGEAIAEAMAEAISSGLAASPNRLEIVPLFRERIGPDLISDLTSRTIYQDLSAYTQEVCQRHGVPTAKMVLRRAAFDARTLAWGNMTAELPVNPASGKAILLVPERFLVPQFDYRDEFGKFAHRQRALLPAGTHLARLVRDRSGEDIINLAKAAPQVAVAWAAARGPKPYNLGIDRKVLWQWDAAAERWANTHRIKLDLGKPDEFVLKLSTQYVAWLATDAARGLLLRAPSATGAAQRMFMGLVGHYCRRLGIDMVGEARLGSGTTTFSCGERTLTVNTVVRALGGRQSQFWDKYQSAPTAGALTAAEASPSHALLVGVRTDNTDKQTDRGRALGARTRTADGVSVHTVEAVAAYPPRRSGRR